ncbi:MAG: hypothetical protein JJ693_06215 [Acidithiobacillus sp.]|nr:hypothetical protein [Acidithiobacillus sp.]
MEVMRSIWLVVLICVALPARAANFLSHIPDSPDRSSIKMNGKGDMLAINSQEDGGLEMLFLATTRTLHLNYPMLCTNNKWVASLGSKSAAEESFQYLVRVYQQGGYKVVTNHQCHLPASMLAMTKDWKTVEEMVNDSRIKKELKTSSRPEDRPLCKRLKNDLVRHGPYISSGDSHLEFSGVNDLTQDSSMAGIRESVVCPHLVGIRGSSFITWNPARNVTTYRQPPQLPYFCKKHPGLCNHPSDAELRKFFGPGWDQ